jgi:hypothetical protein
MVDPLDAARRARSVEGVEHGLDGLGRSLDDHLYPPVRQVAEPARPADDASSRTNQR